MVGLYISGAPHLQVRCNSAFRERLFAIMLMGYEEELHSPGGCARRCGSVPKRCQHRSFRRASAELGVTPSAISQAVRVLAARVEAALFIRNAQCRSDRGRRTIPFACKARLQGARRRTATIRSLPASTPMSAASGQQQSFAPLPLRCTTEINPGPIFRLTRRWSARRSATCPLVPLLAAKSLLASQKLYPIPTPPLPSENNRCNRHRGRG